MCISGSFIRYIDFFLTGTGKSVIILKWASANFAVGATNFERVPGCLIYSFRVRKVPFDNNDLLSQILRVGRLKKE